MRSLLARELLAVARELVYDVDLLFLRDGVDGSTLNAIHSELTKYVDRVRSNEGFDVFSGRSDSDMGMRVCIGITDHEHKDAIIREVRGHAEKLANRMGVRMGVVVMGVRMENED